jgi:hypothetical protein
VGPLITSIHQRAFDFGYYKIQEFYPSHTKPHKHPHPKPQIRDKTHDDLAYKPTRVFSFAAFAPVARFGDTEASHGMKEGSQSLCDC